MSWPRLPRDYWVVLPNLLALVCHIVIFYVAGPEIAGEHALIMAVSSVFAVALTWRADISLLGCKTDEAPFFLFGGLAIAAILSGIFTGATELGLTPRLFSLDGEMYFCALLLATNEMASAWHKRFERKYAFLCARMAPILFFSMAASLTLGYSVISMWSFGLGLSVAISILIILAGNDSLRLPLKLLWTDLPAYFYRATKSVVLALLAVAAANYWIILLTTFYGSAAAGVWANMFRIVFWPIVIYVTYSQYRILGALSRHEDRESRDQNMTSKVHWEREVYLVGLIFLGSIVAFLIFQGMRQLDFSALLSTVFLLMMFSLQRVQYQFFGALTHALDRPMDLLPLLVEIIALTIIVRFFQMSLWETQALFGILLAGTYVWNRTILFRRKVIS